MTLLTFKNISCFLLFFLFSNQAFSEKLYTLKKGDYLGKIVAENYPAESRKTSKHQIMIAILRTNPSAFKGGNVHFLRQVKTLKLPEEDLIATLSKAKASAIIKQHLDSFKKKETGNYAVVPLNVPVSTDPSGVTTKSDDTKKVSIANKQKSESQNTEKLQEKKSKPVDEETKIRVEKTSQRASKNEEKSSQLSTVIKEISQQEELAKQANDISPMKNAAVDEKGLEQESVDSSELETATQSKESAQQEDPKDVVVPIISGEKVRVYNWSDYIPEGVLEEFTKETGIQVEYSTYDSNEIMYQKVKLFKGRGFDVLVPSTYLVQRMRSEGLIQNIDHKQISNFKNLDPGLLNQNYDPNNAFSIPYLWGTTGIIVNRQMIANTEIKSWKDLWAKQWRGKLVLIDDVRDVFHMALKINGHSINTTNSDEIKQAYDRLVKLLPNVMFFSDNPLEELLSQKSGIGTIWNGEAVIAQENSKNYEYIYPEEGASFWVDSFVISNRASNIENAHTFIDYMLRPEVAKKCLEELGYATPNLEALKLVDKNISNNPTIFPEKSIFKKAEFQQDIGSAMELYLFYWGKLKGG